MLGFALSLCLFMLVFAYGLLKLSHLINFEDTTVVQSTLDSHFEITDKITTEEGLAFAYAFTSYDESSQELDPDIGELNASIW